jgi:arsenate reductase
MLFIEYPKCSTSNKAKKWLKDNGITYDKRNIKDNNPTVEELKKWIHQSNGDINQFFNKSGRLYREQGIKDIVKTASEEELLKILASDGMMVKRPLLISENYVLVGFKEELWTSAILQKGIE